MKIVVDKLPCSCESCMFKEWEYLRRHCTLTKCFTDGHDDSREEHCPLVELGEVIVMAPGLKKHAGMLE